MSFHAQILTLYPDMFPGPLGLSLAGRALEKEIWSYEAVNIRDFATDKHRSVDDTPAGGGPGMILRADVVASAIDNTRESAQEKWPLIYLSPRGKAFDQAMAGRFAKAGGITLLCGRFEGVDQRVLDSRNFEEVSIGDYVLSGGEVAAFCVLDSIIRLLPGVLGDPDCLADESFSAGLLEYPQYTRPQEFEGQNIPDVLTSGHHEKIRAWRLEMSEKLTRQRRSDLYERYAAGIKNKKAKS